MISFPTNRTQLQILSIYIWQCENSSIPGSFKSTINYFLFYNKLFLILADFDTDAYSQLMLGVKGLSNSLLDFAESKFDKAIELDQLMGMPKIMKAYLL